ncbi:uncharacterized protein LOC143277803 [Babylonia areolata]|uniref:uncharacterized protein LOC143277803 n=1 Tax=Babylonia areolata TaxID=304850 RepID=UPI003FD47D1D
MTMTYTHPPFSCPVPRKVERHRPRFCFSTPERKTTHRAVPETAGGRPRIFPMSRSSRISPSPRVCALRHARWCTRECLCGAHGQTEGERPRYREDDRSEDDNGGDISRMMVTIERRIREDLHLSSLASSTPLNGSSGSVNEEQRGGGEAAAMTMVTPMMMAELMNDFRRRMTMKEEGMEAVAGVHTGTARLRQQSAQSWRCSCSCRASQGSGPSAPPVAAAGQAEEQRGGGEVAAMTMVTPMMMAAMVNNIRQCVAMKEEDVEAVTGVHTGMARLRQQSAPSRRCSCSCRASQGSGPSAPPVAAAGQAGELPEGVSLPLNSFEELRKLEKKLAEDPKLRQNLVAK